MAILKCKMCGGDLEVCENSFVAVCEFCGSKQTVPNVDDEKKIKLFDRANKLRSICEFDKAYSVYESIVEDFPNEAEAYWGLVLCKFGIEYVDDPKTRDKIPTCHRSSFDSVTDDHNYIQAINNANILAKDLYKSEAEAIEAIRRGIIEISSKEEPYDIFICYKETDKKGERTKDSVLAQEIYKVLTDGGYKVFFSRITLEDKLGVKYEPYIFSALHSAKIMLVVATDSAHVDSVWVKNEWSRYLKLIESDEKKMLIPCYCDIDAYDLPEAFSDLQGVNMSKLGAMQDLIRGIEKIIPKKSAPNQASQGQSVNSNDAVVAPLLRRAEIFLGNNEFDKANEYYEKVLDLSPENEGALIGKLFVEFKVKSYGELKDKLSFAFLQSLNYKNLISFASAETKNKFSNLASDIENTIFNNIKNEVTSGDFEKANKDIKLLSTRSFSNYEFKVYSFLSAAKETNLEALNTSESLSIHYKQFTDLYVGATSDFSAKLDKIKNENIKFFLNKAKNALASKEFDIVSKSVNVIKRIAPDNAQARFYAFLLELDASSLEELKSSSLLLQKKDVFDRYKNTVDNDLRAELENILKINISYMEAQMERFINERNYADASWASSCLLDANILKENILLTKFLSKHKISNISDLHMVFSSSFENDEDYQKLISYCSDETKSILQIELDLIQAEIDKTIKKIKNKKAMKKAGIITKFILLFLSIPVAIVNVPFVFYLNYLSEIPDSYPDILVFMVLAMIALSIATIPLAVKGFKAWKEDGYDSEEFSRYSIGSFISSSLGLVLGLITYFILMSLI